MDKRLRSSQDSILGLAPVTAESEEDWYDQTHKNPRLRAFTIYQSSTMRPIGNTVLADIDYINRTAEFGIMIGEKDCWGKGYGAETATLILDYAFTGLGLHSVLVRAYAYNERGLGAYARAGFKLIGRRREALQRAGRYYDIVYLDCLASEYKSPVLYTLFPGDQL